jgi:hypothetical protein
MNIQSSNINLNLPAVLNKANRGEQLNSSEPAIRPDTTRSQDYNATNTVNVAKKRATIDALDNINQNNKLGKISKESARPSQSIQTYLDNANLANQPQRDELQLLLGIDIFV